jgi:RNase P subunit RPR2
MLDLAAGLTPGNRFRCSACGNLTRFDVESVERVRRYWHAELSGEARSEEEERLEVAVVAVTCRWCGASDSIEVVHAPVGCEGEPAAPG